MIFFKMYVSSSRLLKRDMMYNACILILESVFLQASRQAFGTIFSVNVAVSIDIRTLSSPRTEKAKPCKTNEI
jgi:hypothetical protein